MPNRTGVVLDPACLAHEMGRRSPETPKRLQVLLEMLDGPDCRAMGLVPLDGRKPRNDEILAVHTEGHLRRLAGTQGRTVALDMETTAGPRSYGAAMAAAGCVLAAVEAVAAGEVTNAFAMTRPPGHHAQPDRASGFCLLNNVAIGARFACRQAGLQRVAIVDFDLHHGGGLQQVFYDDPAVMVISTHQSTGWPGTGMADEIGRGAASGTNLNLPLAPGHGDAEYAAIYGGLVARVLEAWKPQMILVAAGFDIFVGDVLGSMDVTAEGFAQIAGHLRRVADDVCGGKLVMALEGGYSVAGLRDGVMACLAAMSAKKGLPRIEGPLSDLFLGDAAKSLMLVKKHFKAA
jgi:acetoin utilization deacetylase AcuC-like enzyme